MIEILLQAAVSMGDILALLLLFAAGALVFLMLEETCSPATPGEDFATSLFNKIEEFRNDFR